MMGDTCLFISVLENMKHHAAAQCCPNGKPEVCGTTSCASISLRSNDPVYSQFNRTCIPLPRTKTTQAIGCNIKPVQQLSQSTHFIDLSLVYGSTDDVARSLRTYKYGLLSTSENNGKQFCPFAPKSECDPRSKVCYSAGDKRVNQNLELTALQVILLREHNRVASNLHKLNPCWNDEKLYQESRRIVIAEAQKITYYEFLPSIIGRAGVSRTLPLPQRAIFSLYDPRINPSTINEFTAGCYRYFHTMINGHNKFVGEDGNEELDVLLRDWFNRPDLIEDDLDGKVRGMVYEPAQEADLHFVDDILKYLFKLLKPIGDDLEAIDIQRGRDHGLPSYNELRHLCGARKARNFSDFGDLIEKSNVDKLSSWYKDVEQVDLFVGTTLEKKVPSSLLGPTCTCVVEEQFRRWREGDRYWFEHMGQPGSFTRDQLDQLGKASLARLICDNTGVTRIQRQAFWLVDDWNPVYPCSQIDSVSLAPWKDLTKP